MTIRQLNDNDLVLVDKDYYDSVTKLESMYGVEVVRVKRIMSLVKKRIKLLWELSESAKLPRDAKYAYKACVYALKDDFALLIDEKKKK